LFPILDLLLAALAPPDRVLEIIAVALDHVNVSSVDHLFSGCDISTVTAREPHQELNSPCSKDWWHRQFASVPPEYLAPVFTALGTSDSLTHRIASLDEIQCSSALSAEMDAWK
jgi:hypothetical protein